MTGGGTLGSHVDVETGDQYRVSVVKKMVRIAIGPAAVRSALTLTPLTSANGSFTHDRPKPGMHSEPYEPSAATPRRSSRRYGVRGRVALASSLRKRS